MSRDTGIGGTSGSLRPGAIAVGVNEDLYCLLGGGDLVEGICHDNGRHPLRSAETGLKKTVNIGRLRQPIEKEAFLFGKPPRRCLTKIVAATAPRGMAPAPTSTTM